MRPSLAKAVCGSRPARSRSSSSSAITGALRRAMRGFLPSHRHGPHTKFPTGPLDRMRHAFERVLSQVQEISNVLLKAQAEAMDILNRCASANMEAFGGMAPDIAKLQQGAVSAMQAATSQVTAAIEEMRRRMSELEGETRQATGGTAGGDGGPAPSGRSGGR